MAAVAAFRKLPEAASLAAANKRIQNILKQAGDKVPEGVDDSKKLSTRARCESRLSCRLWLLPALRGGSGSADLAQGL